MGFISLNGNLFFEKNVPNFCTKEGDFYVHFTGVLQKNSDLVTTASQIIKIISKDD